MKTLPVILASPGAYERLVQNDPSIQPAFAKLTYLVFYGPERGHGTFWHHIQSGDGIATLTGGSGESTIYILTGRGEGFGPPEAHRVPEGHGVYPTREEIRRGRYGLLKRISLS